MFHNKFIACISVDGEIVREEKNNVYLPYGTNFSLYFKNLNSHKIKLLKFNWAGVEGTLSDFIESGAVFEGLNNNSFIFEEDCSFSVFWSKAGENEVVEKITFNLKGVNEFEQISEVSTTKSKKICSSCGKKFKSSYNYCPYDGTYLNNE